MEMKVSISNMAFKNFPACATLAALRLHKLACNPSIIVKWTTSNSQHYLFQTLLYKDLSKQNPCTETNVVNTEYTSGVSGISVIPCYTDPICQRVTSSLTRRPVILFMVLFMFNF